MDAVEIKPGVYWVGAIDWAIRDFHGYITPRGSSYNNYLIMDDEVTLVDSVKHDFVDVSMARINGLTDIRDIKHVVVNHIEPDHASGLAEIMRLIPGVPIYCTKKGRDGLGRFFDLSGWDVRVVKTGDELKIGKRTLLFIETPMIHWPDSMMIYVKEDRILISQDGFGQHLASTQRFDDEFMECASAAELQDAVWDYYANILMPFGTVIRSKIEEIQKLGLEIDMIAPDHGVIWRAEPARAMQMYLDMADGKTDERVVIIYDSMWHNTEKMTQPVMEGIKETGMDCRVMKLRATPTSVAVKEFWRARGCLVGSPTLNNTIFPKIAEFLYYLKGLKPRNRMLGAFGSYGWAGGAVKEILELSKSMKLETVEPGFQFNYRAGADDERKGREFGRDFALKVREYHGKFQ